MGNDPPPAANPLDELRQLAKTIIEINADARVTAEEQAATIRGIADAQCSAAEARAKAILDALDAAESR